MSSIKQLSIAVLAALFLICESTSPLGTLGTPTFVDDDFTTASFCDYVNTTVYTLDSAASYINDAKKSLSSAYSDAKLTLKEAYNYLYDVEQILTYGDLSDCYTSSKKKRDLETYSDCKSYVQMAYDDASLIYNDNLSTTVTNKLSSALTRLSAALTLFDTIISMS